jgi:hypothetical protein
MCLRVYRERTRNRLAGAKSGCYGKQNPVGFLIIFSFDVDTASATSPAGLPAAVAAEEFIKLLNELRLSIKAA